MCGGEEFSPNGRELIFYLTQKTDGPDAPPDEIVEELNFYKHSPEKLSEKHAMSIIQGKLYFFTRVSRKHWNSTSTVPNRTVHGVGAWKSQGKSSYITNANQNVGTKLFLRFNQGGVGPNAHRIPTNWVMEEYKTGRQSQAGDTLYNWVLCKVYQDGEAEAIPNNQANQVQTSVVGVPQGDMVLQHSHEIGTTSEVQQNNNNNSNVRDGGTNELMTNRPCQLVTWKGTSEVVAEGTLLSVDPLQLVGGVTLGAFCGAVSVSRVVKNEEVFRYAPTSNFHTLEDAIGGTIAWPRCCIELSSLCTLYDWTSEHRIAVAEAVVVCRDPSTFVNGWPLGLDCWKFNLTRVLSNGRLFRDIPGGLQYLDDALLGRDIMWPWKHIYIH